MALANQRVEYSDTTPASVVENRFTFADSAPRVYRVKVGNAYSHFQHRLGEPKRTQGQHKEA
jgi:hypothetical protein